MSAHSPAFHQPWLSLRGKAAHPSEARDPITPRVALWELEHVSSSLNSLLCGLLDTDTYNCHLPESIRTKVPGL